MDSRLVHISKEVSYALRHAPEEYGLALDGEGFVPVEALLSALNERLSALQPILRDDLEEIIATSEKRRHEIVGGRIRALYGHSVRKEIERVPSIPPDVLYHGTTRKALGSILQDGLLPMGRQMVHLSTDYETAGQVGERRDNRPVILQVDAATACSEGIEFFEGSDRVWLAKHIPPSCLCVYSSV